VGISWNSDDTQISNSRLMEDGSDSVAKRQLARLAFRSASESTGDRCSLVFLEGHVFN
jgi:hypothetical protein